MIGKQKNRDINERIPLEQFLWECSQWRIENMTFDSIKERIEGNVTEYIPQIRLFNDEDVLVASNNWDDLPIGDRGVDMDDYGYSAVGFLSATEEVISYANFIQSCKYNYGVSDPEDQYRNMIRVGILKSKDPELYLDNFFVEYELIRNRDYSKPAGPE